MHWFLWFLAVMFFWQSLISWKYTIPGTRPKEWDAANYAMNSLLKLTLGLGVLMYGGVL